MKRREFISLLGSAVAPWPLAARAQQPTIPVIGLLSPRASGEAPQLIAAVRQGLKDSGYVEGQNVTIEYRFAENQNERLAALAADLVHRQVTVIVAAAAPAAVAGRAATTSIPIIFEMGDDLVRLGLVASLRRPGGNITGATQLNREVAPKRLELLHELLPNVSVMALLANPTDASSAFLSNNTMTVAHSLGLELHVLNASSERDFDGVFANP
jgi:putative ABC transport system substrate-binding protein